MQFSLLLPGLTGSLVRGKVGYIQTLDHGIAGGREPLPGGKRSESVAVGSEMFVRVTKEKLGFKVKFREVFGAGRNHELREPPSVIYKGILSV